MLDEEQMNLGNLYETATCMFCILNCTPDTTVAAVGGLEPYFKIDLQITNTLLTFFFTIYGLKVINVSQSI